MGQACVTGDLINLHQGLKSSMAGSTVNRVLKIIGRPSYEPFPGVDDTKFGYRIQEGTTAYACEMLQEHFEEKEALKARVNFLLYQARNWSSR